MALPPPRPPLRGGLAKPPTNGSEDALTKSRREKDELESECKELEELVEELKVKYEQYFLGVERKEPVRVREELKKRVLRIKEAFTRNTGLKFRLQSLHARFISYERLWLRSAREKEEGTYRRDLFKARLRSKGEPAAPPPEQAPAPKAPTDRTATGSQPGTRGAPAPAAGAAAGAVAQRTPPPSATPSPAQRPAAPAGGMRDAEMRALYDAYIAAKRSCKEDVSRLTYDAVARSVSKQIPELITRYKAKSVDFKVEVKDGKAILKAIPKV